MSVASINKEYHFTLQEDYFVSSINIIHDQHFVNVFVINVLILEETYADLNDRDGRSYLLVIRRRISSTSFYD